MSTKEYSVGRAYKIVGALFLVLSPYFYYRFFADLIYGQDGEHWKSILISFQRHPAIMIGLLGVPTLVVFVVLVLLTYRFAVDLVFPTTVSGVLEGAETAKKTRFAGERLPVQISGRRLSLLADLDPTALLLSREAVGRNVLIKIGGFGKVLYLRID